MPATYRIAGFLLALALLACAPPNRASAEETELAFRPTFDLRLRQEILDNAFHFTPLADRNWIRVRSRAGLVAERGRQIVELRFCNEFRKIMTPDTEIDADEIVIDRLLWRADMTRGGRALRLTLGRQDIIWNRGFLMLEGHPLDGSRSMYHTAARVEVSPTGLGKLDLALIHNPRRDPAVLYRDRDRDLSDGDETALALRLSGGANGLILIAKRERDPGDLLPAREDLTVSYRREESLARQGMRIFYEIAAQKASGLSPAFAGQAEMRSDWGDATTVSGGFFHYSGDGRGVSAFRAPWGRWPKWSELYIYTLIPERGVANWQNVSAPHVGLLRRVGAKKFAGEDLAADLRLHAYYLSAMEPEWTSRGALTQVELQLALGKRFTGHLLWERLAPGDFHAGQDDAVHFFRWQMNAALH